MKPDLMIEGIPARWVAEGYALTSDGRAWSFWRTLGPRYGNQCVIGEVPRLMAARPNAKGYLRLQIDRVDRYLHRLMWEVWVGPIPDGLQIRHLDWNVKNNALTNLAVGTPADNDADKDLHGTRPVGERHANARLTRKDVLMARALWRDGVSLDEIIARLGLNVNRGSLHEAVTGATWRQLDALSPPYRPGRWRVAG